MTAIHIYRHRLYICLFVLAASPLWLHCLALLQAPRSSIGKKLLGIYGPNYYFDNDEQLDDANAEQAFRDYEQWKWLWWLHESNQELAFKKDRLSYDLWIPNFQNLKLNYKLVADMNKKQSQVKELDCRLQYSLGKYAFILPDEFFRLHTNPEPVPLGPNIPSWSGRIEFEKHWLALLRQLNVTQNQLIARLPVEFDWRHYKHTTENDGVSDVVAQTGDIGPYCAVTWAFAITGNMHAQLLLAKNKFVNLSTTFLVDCDVYGDMCEEGTSTFGYESIKLTGIYDSTIYPERPLVPGELCSDSKVSKRNKPLTIDNYVSLDTQDEEVIRAYLFVHGPLSAGICTRSLQFYKSGVVCPDSNIDPCERIDNYVLLVGWGTTTKSKVDYWIAQASFGTEWGEQGYIRIKRNSNVLFVREFVESANIERPYSSFILERRASIRQ